jgi:hypothetical protein
VEVESDATEGEKYCDRTPAPGGDAGAECDEDESADDGPSLVGLLVSEFSRRSAAHPCAPSCPRGPARSPGEDCAPEGFFEQLAAEALTERERQVLDLHLDGCTNEAIAAQLRCHERTVRRALDSIQEKATKFYGERTAPDRRSTTMAHRGLGRVTHDGLRDITRPMTADEWADHCAGYPASRYRRRAANAPPTTAERELAPVVVLDRVRAEKLHVSVAHEAQRERAAA